MSSERISGSALKEFVTTNTIVLPDEIKNNPKFKQLTIAKVFGQGILNIIDDKAVSDLFDYRGKHER